MSSDESSESESKFESLKNENKIVLSANMHKTNPLKNTVLSIPEENEDLSESKTLGKQRS